MLLKRFRNVASAISLDTPYFDAIRHVRNEHPNVELRDFLLIPLILKEPIAIKAGSQKNTVVFKKTLVLDYSCVELIVDDTKSLRLKTFYFNEPKVRK